MLAWLASGTLLSIVHDVLAIVFDLTLKGTVLLALAGGVVMLLQRASAAVRHQVWVLAFCGFLLLPIFALSLPAWRVPVPVRLPFVQETAILPDQQAATPEQATGTNLESAGGSSSAAVSTEARTTVWPAGEVEGQAPPPSSFTTVLWGYTALVARTGVPPWSFWLMVLWASGVLVVLFRFILGAIGVAWMTSRTGVVSDPALRKLAEDVRRRLKVRRAVRLLCSNQTAMPMTWGILRPLIMLPPETYTWSEDRRVSVVTHEMAHIKRWDCLIQGVVQLACAVNWFNPVVWRAARRLRVEREMACDDYVLRSGINPFAYATHLLDIARTARTMLILPAGAVAMARPSHLEGRLRAILDTTRARGVMNRVSTLIIGTLTVGLVVPLAAMQPSYSENGGAGTADDFEAVIVKERPAYRWSAVIEKGKTIDIHGIRGRVQATPSAGSSVEIIALPEDSTFSGNMLVVEEDDGVVICFPDPDNPQACISDAEPVDTATQVVDVVAYIPAGVRFSGQTKEGNVTVVGLQSDVVASTWEGDIFVQAAGLVSARAGSGDITLRTTSFGWAATERGNINARIGRTTWEGELPFHSREGNITVELPEDVHTDINLHVEADGELGSGIPIQQRTSEQGKRFEGTIGRGGRLLAIHTGTGNITITSLSNQPLQPFQHIDVRLRQNKGLRGQPDQIEHRASTETTPNPAYTMDRSGSTDEEGQEVHEAGEAYYEASSLRGPAPH